MRTLLSAALGFIAGLALAYGVAIVWNPNYERAIPLLLIGALMGALTGARIGGRKPR